VLTSSFYRPKTADGTRYTAQNKCGADARPLLEPGEPTVPKAAGREHGGLDGHGTVADKNVACSPIRHSATGLRLWAPASATSVPVVE
jgi:hypothetical protein